MPMKKRYAAVFVHGLAKKPAPPKLEEIWLWGLGRDDPNGDVFPRLLLDSRVVDVPRSSNFIVVTLSFSKSLFFNQEIPRSLLRGYLAKGRA
jgi:hypothetical protein